MATEIRVQTRVQPGGRIVVTDPELQAGETVDVIIQMPSSGEKRHSIFDVLEQTPGHLMFHSAEEVDAYIREERDAWER